MKNKMKFLAGIVLAIALFATIGAGYKSLMVDSSNDCGQTVNFTGAVKLGTTSTQSTLYTDKFYHNTTLIDPLYNTGGGTVQYQLAMWSSATARILQATQVYTDASGSIDIPTGQSYKINGTGIASSNLSDIDWTAIAQGDIFYYNGTKIVNLAPGTSGYFLKTQGAAANPVWDASPSDVSGPAGGTAQYQAAVYADTTGKVLQASQFYTDATGSIDIPTGQSYKINGTGIASSNLSDIDWTAIAQGDIFYYNGTKIVNLAPGTSGYFLKTQGAAANPVWAATTGDVAGPAGGTAQYQAAVYADATGKVIQASQFYTDASGSIDIPTGQNYKINGSQIAANNLSDFAVSSPALGDMLYFDGNDFIKASAAAASDGDVPMVQADGSIAFETPPGAAGGETNTASNVGTSGVGIFKQKTVADLELYKVLGSAGISWALNGTDYIDVKAVINTLGEKTSVVAADELMLSDSADSNAIKKVLISTLFGVHATQYIDAGAWVPCTTNPAATGQYEYATNDIDMEHYAFDTGATEERIQLKWAMPDEWDKGTLKVKFFWTSATGSTAGDTVEWAIKAGAVSDGDAIDAALGDPVTVSDTLLADNGGDMQVSAASAAMTVGGTPALGDMIFFEIYRNTDGTDDMTEDAWLAGIQIQWKKATAPVATW